MGRSILVENDSLEQLTTARPQQAVSDSPVPEKIRTREFVDVQVAERQETSAKRPLSIRQS